MELKKAKLIKRDICGCGYGQVRDDVPLGKEYRYDPKSMRKAKLECGGCHKIHILDVVMNYDQEGNKKGWFLMDALDAVKPTCLEVYSCAACGEEFTAPEDWSEEQALQEVWERYGDVPIEDLARICDSCHEKFLAWEAKRKAQGIPRPERQPRRVN